MSLRPSVPSWWPLCGLLGQDRLCYCGSDVLNVVCQLHKKRVRHFQALLRTCEARGIYWQGHVYMVKWGLMIDWIYVHFGNNTFYISSAQRSFVLSFTSFQQFCRLLSSSSSSSCWPPSSACSSRFNERKKLWLCLEFSFSRKHSSNSWTLIRFLVKD